MLKIDIGFIDFIKYAVVLIIFINFDVRAAGEFNLKFYQEKDYYKPKILSNDQMLTLAGLSDENRFKNILSKILIPRVPGTPEHEQVKDFLANSLRDLNWSVELDEFSQYIPNQKKTVKFTTVIGRLNNDASRYLVLACHYDSKYMKDQVFYAATDSAVPCAMLIDIALSLNEYLKPYRSKDLSLMFIFFDGEEAFDKWGPNDSIYGSRHLAKLWQDEPFPLDNANQLQRMDVLMLLDLLGAPDPKFYFYQAQTRHLHYLLADIQNKLDNLNELKDYSKSSKYFLKQKSYGFIEDDHLPFMLAQTPVPILHIIPQPFPGVWHTLKDDHTALDFPTIDNLNKIFRIFTLCYLRGSFDEDAYRRSLNRTSAASDTNGFVNQIFNWFNRNLR